MTNESVKNAFKPDYAVHPGEILEEILSARGISKVQLANRSERSPKTISQIINGKANVTPEIAIQFEHVLGISANIWNNLDANYRLFIAKKQERQSLEKNVSWAREFPLRELINKETLPKRDNLASTVRDLLDFFGVASVDAWNAQYNRIAVQYRKSSTFASSLKPLAAWLRIGELIAENIKTEPYEKDKFIQALKSIRNLTDKAPASFQPEMEEMCRKAGVAVVFVEELPGIHISGATRWLAQDKALLMLSLRHKSDDHLWFTFFHETCHILRHGKKSIFIDAEKSAENTEENEANSFAEDFLVPPKEYADFCRGSNLAKTNVIGFASSIGVAPGIVVGRLQHDKLLPYSSFNNLKKRLVLISKNNRNRRFNLEFTKR